MKKMNRRYLSPKSEIGPCFAGTGDFRILFLNTNPYRIGIANLGWQTVVEYLLVACPFVSVRVEYLDTIKTADLKPFDYNLVVIHIPFETNYPITIWMLKQIGFPLLSRDRDNSFPIVIAGGLYNPSVLSDFIDIFVFGDGRVPMTEIVNLCFVKRGIKKRILRLLNERRIRGVFIPALGSYRELVFASPELSLSEYPIHTIWSNEENAYGFPPDYLSIITALGCRYKCPFCLISHCQGIGKDRETKIHVEETLEILQSRRQFISIKTVKLFFASSVDKEDLKATLRNLIKERVRTLVGSLNCKQIDEELVILLKESGENRITIAPETNQRQRWKISKDYITDEMIFEIVKLSNKHHLPISLYLMYGLPGEEDEDIIELGNLVKDVRRLLDKELEMQVHCNQLYLKPHTPWQYGEQILPEENRRKFNFFLRQLLDVSRVEIKTVDLYSSLLQTLFARGDREMAELLINIASRPISTYESLMKEAEKLLPGWKQRYFAKKKSIDLPWSKIVFQSHEVLWQRWISFKRKLDEKGR